MLSHDQAEAVRLLLYPTALIPQLVGVLSTLALSHLALRRSSTPFRLFFESGVGKVFLKATPSMKSEFWSALPVVFFAPISLSFVLLV
jgi:hypothetical protein